MLPLRLLGLYIASSSAELERRCSKNRGLLFLFRVEKRWLLRLKVKDAPVIGGLCLVLNSNDLLSLAWRLLVIARLIYAQRERIFYFPKIPSTKAPGSKGARSSGFSPRPANKIGSPSSR